MKYRNNNFFIENIKTETIAKKYGTPSYCYSYSKLKNNILNFKKNFKILNPLICFAVKSNPNLYLLKEIKKFGLGADVVSIGELMRALKAGINPKKIVFSGVGKTEEEIRYAINKKILDKKLDPGIGFSSIFTPGSKTLHFSTSDLDSSRKTVYAATWKCLESQNLVQNLKKSRP